MTWPRPAVTDGGRVVVVGKDPTQGAGFKPRGLQEALIRYYKK